MKRVDWPTEPGWWWVFVNDRLAKKPVKFVAKKEALGLDPSVSTPLWEFHDFLEFEGPIEEPKMPMRFEIEGAVQVYKIWSNSYHCGGSAILHYVEKGQAIPDKPEDKDRRYKITFEEIL